MILTMSRLKSFCDIVLPETIRYSHQLYTNAILVAFMTNGQYHFFPQITGLESDNAWSSRPTPPIPWLFAAIAAGCWIFCFSFPFIRHFARLIGCTLYALLPIKTTELSFHLTISILPSLLKSKNTLSFFFIFWHQLEETSLSYHFSLCQLPWIHWLRGHISLNSFYRSCQSKRCHFLDFSNFQNTFYNTCTKRFITTLICPSLISFDFIGDCYCTG